MQSLPKADSNIIFCFHQSGMNTAIHGMGISPLSWTDVKSFSECSGCDLHELEVGLLQLMSRCYCSWLMKGKEKGCFSPWDDQELIVSEKAKEDLVSAAKSIFRRK